MGSLLGFASAAVSFGTGAVWYRRMQAVDIPADKRRFIGLMATGAVLGVLALLLGTGWVGGVAAWAGLALGGVFCLLQLQAGQSRTVAAVQVGAPLLDFRATDDRGEPFEPAALAGRPILLKFFRGHW